MNWIGTKKQKESITDDGYHLIVKYVNHNSYTWLVYFKGKLLKNFENKSLFKDSIPRAKRQAIRLMVRHMLKKIN